MSDMAERLAMIDADDRALELAHFTADDAWALGAHLRERAAACAAPVAVLIRRSGGATQFAAALEGASADNSKWAARKAAVAILFERSSLAVALDLKARNLTVADFGLPQSDFAAAPGAVPIRVAGAGCIAAIAMSGLSGPEDHALVMEAIRWLHGRQAR
jgi:uncharacterized protein (UPF0303 family)